ncbi:MAG: peptidoglycan-binding protein [Gluconacetobacter diazotrophicus]|nr:peptidoglycan-binding protein [Gluconacetobacter diazotrophicus]
MAATIEDGTAATIRAAIERLNASIQSAHAAAPAEIYLCGRTAVRNNRLFLLPVAAANADADVYTQGILLKSLLAMLGGGGGTLFADLSPLVPGDGTEAAARQLASPEGGARLVLALGTDRPVPHAAADAVAGGAATAGRDAGPSWTSVLRPVADARHDGILVISPPLPEQGPAAPPVATATGTPVAAATGTPVAVATGTHALPAASSPSLPAAPSPPPPPANAAGADATPVPAGGTEAAGSGGAATPPPKPAPPPAAGAANTATRSPPPPSAGAATATRKPRREVQEANQRIRRIQVALLAKGYYAGRVSGELDAGTQYAIRAFQRSLGAAETGSLAPDQVVRLLNR